MIGRALSFDSATFFNSQYLHSSLDGSQYLHSSLDGLGRALSFNSVTPLNSRCNFLHSGRFFFILDASFSIWTPLQDIFLRCQHLDAFAGHFLTLKALHTLFFWTLQNFFAPCHCNFLHSGRFFFIMDASFSIWAPLQDIFLR